MSRLLWASTGYRLSRVPQGVRIPAAAPPQTLKQAQGWLRHAQLTTAMNVYIQQVDDGLGGAEQWDEILGQVVPRVCPEGLLRESRPSKTAN
jgi:hypothetical protein